jgi:hypothetical protein
MYAAVLTMSIPANFLPFTLPPYPPLHNQWIRTHVWIFLTRTKYKYENIYKVTTCANWHGHKMSDSYLALRERTSQSTKSSFPASKMEQQLQINEEYRGGEENRVHT